MTGMRKRIDMKERETGGLGREVGRTAERLTGMGEPVEKTLKALGGIRQLRGHYVSVHRIWSLSRDYGLLL